MSMKKALTILCCAIALAGVGCKKSADQNADSGPAKNYVTIDPATAGMISGTIHFDGKPPARIPIDMGQDPVDGLGNKAYAAPSTPVVMDQKGCRYIPHVIGVMAGQPIKFTNSDGTMHNVHMTPTLATNQSVDISQPPNGGGETRTLATPELMIPVRCNNHPWMQAFINVAANPFYAVSDADGHFTIKGLPPGTYTVVADHEVLGTQTATITVASQQTAKQDFTFQPKAN